MLVPGQASAILVIPRVQCVAEYGGQQQRSIRWRFAGLQVIEMLREIRPAIHFKEEIGDLDVRQNRICPFPQGLCRFGNIRVEWRDLESIGFQYRIWQLIGLGQAVHLIECGAQALQPLGEIGLWRIGDGDRQRARLALPIKRGT
jgi:hypothetical protein